MLINRGNLKTLGTGFKASFKGGLGQASSQYQRIATVVPSSTGEEEYGWLGKVPRVREWLGDRVVQSMGQHGYTLKNKDYELTIGVDRNHIQDDNLGIYGPLFTEMGMATGAHKDELSFGLLAAGFATLCYDKQFFFDTDHPVLDENGVEQSVSNMAVGAAAPWFLVDDSRALKPIILQLRKDFDFVSKDDPEDDNVFNRKEFIYGADARMNAGFGFWQFAFGSKVALDATSYEAARVALRTMKGDYGRPLGIKPRLLVVGPENEGAAMEILNNERDAAGATNKWKGTAELLVADWL